MDVEKILNLLNWDIIIPYLISLGKAIAILLIGFWGIKRMMNIMRKALQKSSISADIIPFFTSLVDVALKVLLIFTVAGIVGIETTSFVAVIGAVAFSVGFALQGSLSNFAAGVIILLFRPYRVNDWIDINEKFGQVEEIQIFNTIIVTPGKKTLIIPNGQIVGNVVTNYSSKGHVRVEMEVTMAYAESYPKVEAIIRQVLENAPKVLKSPAPEVGILAYETHFIVLAVRPYVHPDDYWAVRFGVYKMIKEAFHQNDIKVSYSDGVELGDIGA